MWAKKKQYEYTRNTKTGSEHVSKMDRNGRKKGCPYGASLAGNFSQQKLRESTYFTRFLFNFQKKVFSEVVTWDIQPFEVGKELPLPPEFVAAGGRPCKKWGVGPATEAVAPSAKRQKLSR